MKLSVCTRKGLFVVERAGDWRIASRHFIGQPVTAALVDPTGSTWLAALRLGHFGVKLWRSVDGGAHWEEVAAPAYGPRPDDASDDPHPWNVDQIWALDGVHPRAPGRVWAGTIPGGLFRSDDLGASWSLNQPLWHEPRRRLWFGGGYDHPGIHSICVSPADPDDIVVGVSCGGSWRTRDAGASWVVATGMQASYMPPERQDDPAIQDPHRIVRCAGAPHVLWSQHHNGIFRSDDGGSLWRRISGAQPSDFGFAVAVHPGDPERAWFVPLASDQQRVPVDARVTVSTTGDGGRSWRSAGAGLPAADAYHLVYRHGLAISGDGRWLAMASMTGSLWMSDDGGSRWTLFSADLPSVYAVGFIA